jgi:hypothetical protein
MDNPSANGNNSLLISILLGIFSWMTPEVVDIGVKIVTAAGAVIAAIFAARYHYYAAKEKKEQIRRLKAQERDEDIFE